MIPQQENIVNCPACGQPMDVSQLPPYANAICPGCQALTRVKTRMGPYRITGKLGKGGMSVVFRAEDAVLGREVALKVLNDTYAGDALLCERFEREARIMARVSHENLVQLYAVGRDQGLFYIAMELVEGNGLDALIAAEERVPEDRVLRLTLDIVRGLDAAWNAGLMHRDIKPANVLLSPDGATNMGYSLLRRAGNAVARRGGLPYGHVRFGSYHVPFAGRCASPCGRFPVFRYSSGEQEKSPSPGAGGERRFPNDLFHCGQADGF